TTLQLAREGTVQGIKDSQNDLRWFRMLALGIRAEKLEEQFRLFLGTRILIDAALVVGAHGAIPATSNVAPAAAAEAWEAAVLGDLALAARAQEVVLRYEELADIARGGSPDAAGYSSMKNTLREWGVIDNARLTRPLREFGEEEVAELRRRLQRLGATVAGLTPAQLRALAADPAVARIHLDAPVKATATTDNSTSGPTPIVFQQTVGATSAWNAGDMGQGVTVAILDSGIDNS